MTHLLTPPRPSEPRRVPIGTTPVHEQPPPRWLVHLAVAGALAVIAGLLLDTPWALLVGGSMVGTAAVWSMVVSPAWMIVGFIAVRPVLDLGPTYGRGPNLNSAAGALLLAAIARWTWLHRARLARPHPSVLAAGAFAGAALLSALGARDPATAFQEALRVIIAVALFALGDQLCRHDPGFLLRVAFAFVVSAALAILPAIAQIVGTLEIPGLEGIDDAVRRPTGPYPAPTVLAAHLVISSALLLMLVPRCWNHPRTRAVAPVLFGIGVVSMWVLLENKSRSPSGALLLVAGVFAVVRWKRAGAIVMAMVGLAAVATIDTSAVRLDEIGTGVNTGASADTFEWRTDYWRDNLPRFQDSPATGIGLGRVQQLHIFHQPPHNVYVQTVIEMGIVGALALAALMGLLARDLWRALRRTRGTPWFEAVLLATLLCGAYAFMGVFENLITQLVTTGPLALLTGCALGSARTAARSR